MILRNAEKNDYKYIKPLYKSAFPRDERAPLKVLKKRVKRGKAEMLCAFDGSLFVGMVYLVSNEDLAYIFYLAVEQNERGKGRGSDILTLLKERYSSKRLFLARETLDPQSQNYSERLKRHEFYLKNGFVDLNSNIKEANVVYDVMSIGGDLKGAEYEKLISAWSGAFWRRIIDMRLIEK